MGYARDKYELTDVGATGILQASTHNLSPSDFKPVVTEFEGLESEGLIEITYLHCETESGMKHVDIVKFVRVV